MLCVCYIEGKAAKSISNANFNKQASKAYKEVTDDDIEELSAQIDTRAVMTTADVKKRVFRITRNMQREVQNTSFHSTIIYHVDAMQFEELQSLGYKGFAIAFGNGLGSSQLVGTQSVVSSFTVELCQYLYGIVITGELLLRN